MFLALRSRHYLSSCHSRLLSSSSITRSGHNKWSKIKEKKGANDQKKGLLYARVYRDIMIAIRQGGSPDPELNVGLAAVLRSAKSLGVPKENIEKALAKATGGKEKQGQHVVYEAMAHGSVGVLVECLTDNSARTVANLRDILHQNNARFADVSFLFQRRGSVRVALAQGEDFDERVEQLIGDALEAGASDFEEVLRTPDLVEMEFYCPTNALAQVTSACTNKGSDLRASELIYSPVDVVEGSEEMQNDVADLVEELEESGDTLRVWTTLGTSDRNTE